MVAFLLLTCVSFALLGFIIGIWAQNFEQLQLVPLLVITPLGVPRRRVLLDLDAAGGLADGEPVQPGGLPHLGLPLVVLRAADVPVGWSLVAIGVFLGAVPRRGGVDLPQRLAAQALKSGGDRGRAPALHLSQNTHGTVSRRTGRRAGR
jgi:hypothetical protein